MRVTHHSDGVTLEQLLRGEHGEVGHVSQHVDDGHHRHRDPDGSGQVSEGNI